MDTPESLKYTHHFIVHQCRAPVGSTDEETFEHLVDQPGGDCYGATSGIPIEYCRTYLFVWAVGGKVIKFIDFSTLVYHTEPVTIRPKFIFHKYRRTDQIFLIVRCIIFFLNSDGSVP